MDTRGVPPAPPTDAVDDDHHQQQQQDSIPELSSSTVDDQGQLPLSLDLNSIPEFESAHPAAGRTESDDAIARHCSLCLNGTTHRQPAHNFNENDFNLKNNSNNNNGQEEHSQQPKQEPQQQADEPNHSHISCLVQKNPEHLLLDFNAIAANNTSPLSQHWSRTPSVVSQAQSTRSFRLGEESAQVDQRSACDLHDDHGPSAFEEEEAALKHAAELAAARKVESVSGAGTTSIISRIRSRTLSNLGLSLDPPRRSTLGGGAGGRGENEDEQEEEERNAVTEHTIEEEEENDHCFSGLCIPQSRFFFTSVICSNTMTRDGLANERTFLSWMSVCVSLCIVSFTFISKTITLDTLVDNSSPVPDHPQVHKDKLSLGIGYACFIAAFLASIYSLLKYLRNIRRISTRYPFAQAGKWTFTAGMSLGTVIMVVLVLAYTSDL